MTSIFGLLFIFSIILLLIGLMKPKLAFQKSRKQVIFVYVSICIVCIIGIEMISRTVKKENENLAGINVSTQLNELTPSESANPYLKPEVTSLDAPVITRDNLKIQLIGAGFGDKDSKNVLGIQGINNVESFEVGYVSGRTAAKMKRDNGTKSKDAILYLFFEVTALKNMKNHKIDFKVTFFDEQGNRGIPLVNSLENYKLSHQESKPGMVSFLVNSHTNTFTVNIDDQSFIITELPYKQ